MSSPSRVSVSESQPLTPASRGGAAVGRPLNASSLAGEKNKNPLSKLMEDVSSSDSECEDRLPTSVKSQPKPPLKSPSESLVRTIHPPPAPPSASTTPRQLKKDPELSSDDEVTPTVRDTTKTSVKREAPPRKAQPKEKKKRRTQPESPVAKIKVPQPVMESVKPIKEEIKSEIINNVKEEPNDSSQISAEYLQELTELHQKIMNSVNAVDRQKIQEVVDIIAEHSSFSLTTAHFNFDLCSLDVQVVKQLQGCFS